MRVKQINPKFEEPNSSRFDPSFNCWVLYSRYGGYQGYLMGAVDELFIQTNVSDYHSKVEVVNTCLKHGYFGYGNFAISYLPQSNTSSLELMKGEEIPNQTICNRKNWSNTVMDKKWFHIPSLGRSIDLNLASDIIWNNKFIGSKNEELFTSVFLGTSVAASDGYGVCHNEIAIKSDKDRQELYACFPGIPIKLCLNNDVVAKVEDSKVLEPVDDPIGF
jgi:hypothetical protein